MLWKKVWELLLFQVINKFSVLTAFMVISWK